MMPTGAHASVATSRAPKASQGLAGMAYDSTARPRELRNKGRATCHRRSPAAEETECCCHASCLQQTLLRQNKMSGHPCKQIPLQHASKFFAGLQCGSQYVQQLYDSVVSSGALTCGLAVLGVE